MAGPIAHIACAIAILQSGQLPFQTDAEKQAFIIGTSFPDIRYLKVIEREKTHVANITWEMVQREQSPFKSGLLFHSLVDKVREQFIAAHNLYQILPGMPGTSQMMKLTEDRLLYRQIKDWLPLCNCFDEIMQEEVDYGIEPKMVLLWHKCIAYYCKKKPDIARVYQLISQPVFTKHMPWYAFLGKSIMYYYLATLQNRIANNNYFIQAIRSFYAHSTGYLTGQLPIAAQGVVAK